MLNCNIFDTTCLKDVVKQDVADALARWNYCQRIKGRSVKIEANMFASGDRLASFLLRNPPDSDDESESLQPPLKRTRR